MTAQDTAADSQHNDDTDPEPVPQEQIEVHWQHPRHPLENPVLLVWPNPMRENWAAEIIEGNVAHVVCREVLWRDNDDEIQKFGERVGPRDEIPGYVKTALLNYDGEYGPVTDVTNPVRETDAEPPSNPEDTFAAYFNGERGQEQGSDAE